MTVRRMPSYPVLITYAFSALLWCASPAWSHGALDEKIEAMRILLTEEPSNPILHYQMAALHLEHADTTAALTSLDQLDELKPHPCDAEVLRSEVLLAMMRPHEALALVDTFLETHQNHSAAHALRARTLGVLGRSEEALAAYRAALTGTPPAGMIVVQEFAALLTQEGRVQEAADVLGAALAKHGQVVPLLVESLEAEATLARWDRALDRVAALQQLDPLPELWIARRAELLAKAGRPDESLKTWEELSARLAALPNLQRGSAPFARLAQRTALALKPTAAP
jgi:tetratricopeptide (TPR) repeat protein